MMTDKAKPQREPTVEERAVDIQTKLQEASGALWIAMGFSPRPLPDICELVTAEICAAVAAQKEKDAKHIGFLLSAVRSGEPAYEGHCSGCDEIFAAIRGQEDD